MIIRLFLVYHWAINRELSRTILNIQQQISPYPLVFLPAFLAFTSCILITAGFPRSGKNQEKEHFFKVREFVKKSGKIFVIVKVSEKSGNTIFIAHKIPWKEFENKDRNIDGLPKKPKQMYINTDFIISSSSSSSSSL